MKTLASAVVTESSLYSTEQVPRQNQVNQRLCGRPYSGAFMFYLSWHDAHAQKSPRPMVKMLRLKEVAEDIQVHAVDRQGS